MLTGVLLCSLCSCINATDSSYTSIWQDLLIGIISGFISGTLVALLGILKNFYFDRIKAKNRIYDIITELNEKLISSSDMTKKSLFIECEKHKDKIHDMYIEVGILTLRYNLPKDFSLVHSHFRVLSSSITNKSEQSTIESIKNLRNFIGINDGIDLDKMQDG